MEYLNIFKTKLTNTVVDTVYMAENITKTVLPGNPVTREYEVTKHVGSAGPGLLWKLYAGYKKSTKQVFHLLYFSTRVGIKIMRVI
jgi:SCY1-like protein 2